MKEFLSAIVLGILAFALIATIVNIDEIFDGFEWPWVSAARRIEAESLLASMKIKENIATLQLGIAEEQTEKTQWETQKPLFDAASYTIVKNADLVEWYAKRGDLRADYAVRQAWKTAFWIFVLLLFCAFCVFFYKKIFPKIETWLADNYNYRKKIQDLENELEKIRNERRATE